MIVEPVSQGTALQARHFDHVGIADVFDMAKGANFASWLVE